MRKIIFCLAWSDFGYALSCVPVFMLPVFEEDVEFQTLGALEQVVCVFQSGGIQYFQLSSFLWTSCIAFHAYSAYVKKRSITELEFLMKWYYVVCWILPAFPTMILYSVKAFGLSYGCWCWILERHSYLRLILFWGPVVILWVFNCICYYLVNRAVKEVMSFIETNAQRRMLGYVGVFLVIGVIPIVNRLLLQFHMKPNFIFGIVSRCFNACCDHYYLHGCRCHHHGRHRRHHGRHRGRCRGADCPIEPQHANRRLDQRSCQEQGSRRYQR